jgi:hypothetical protein
MSMFAGRQLLPTSMLAPEPFHTRSIQLLTLRPWIHSSIHCHAYLLLLLITKNVIANIELSSNHINPLADSGSGERPDDCEACVSLVKSFEKGLERTKRGKHEGGDTSWEEKNLKSYADSEVRLVEIQDDLCNDLDTGKAQCLSMAETAEHHIEEWWFEHRNKNVRLHDYLCISKLKKCCPDGKYGPKCQKCPDCNEHGKCDGSGTRGGSGECNCNQGYTGKFCDQCDEDYYKSRFGIDGKFECLKCHKACSKGCSGPTSSNCTECAPGYARDPLTNLCNDINECELQPGELNLDSKRLCPDGTYCENTDGHYKCSRCHYVCQTCLDYGRDKCLTCSTDHYMDVNHTCVHFSAQTADQSTLEYYLYAIFHFASFAFQNYFAHLIIQYIIHVTIFRHFHFAGDLILESTISYTLSLYVVVEVAKLLGTHTFNIRMALLLMNLFGDDGDVNVTDTTESPDAQSNLTRDLELMAASL